MLFFIFDQQPYDTINRLRKLVAGERHIKTVYDYNQFGTPVEIKGYQDSNPVYTYNFDYFNDGSLKNKTLSIDGKTLTFDKTYDNAGQLDILTIGGQYTKELDYDPGVSHIVKDNISGTNLAEVTYRMWGGVDRIRYNNGEYITRYDYYMSRTTLLSYFLPNCPVQLYYHTFYQIICHEILNKI